MNRTIANLALPAIAAVLLSGCVSVRSYVDPALPAAGKGSIAAVSNPQPIQVLYEFRTRGNPNARATEATKARVSAVAGESGLFSEVSQTPVASGRRLTVTLDNVPITDEGDAKLKGFGTGLTFGLVGTMVTDGYVCEAVYTVPNKDPLKLEFRHALHTTIGNASGPPGLAAVSPQQGIDAIVDQLMWSILRELSKGGRL
jgi:hypothetical protein